jgi:hypothetical protein
VAVAAKRSADHAVGVHGRAAELARIGRFLDEVASGPSPGPSHPTSGRSQSLSSA